MAWRYHGRAGAITADTRSPVGICDRCGFMYLLKDLVFQYAYRGSNLSNTGFRVCTVTCLDTPTLQYYPLVLPADPQPAFQPRIENYAVDEAAGNIAIDE